MGLLSPTPRRIWTSEDAAPGMALRAPLWRSVSRRVPRRAPATPLHIERKFRFTVIVAIQYSIPPPRCPNYSTWLIGTSGLCNMCALSSQRQTIRYSAPRSTAGNASKPHRTAYTPTTRGRPFRCLAGSFLVDFDQILTRVQLRSALTPPGFQIYRCQLRYSTAPLTTVK